MLAIPVRQKIQLKKFSRTRVNITAFFQKWCQQVNDPDVHSEIGVNLRPCINSIKKVII